MPPTLTAIHIYPVKSCRGITLTSAQLEVWGLRFDRNWMVVTPEGKFLTQREVPRLALVEAIPQPAGLQLNALGQPSLLVPSSPPDSAVEVEVWGDWCWATDQGDAAAAWFSQVLDRPCRLVQMGQGYDRPVNPLGLPDAQVSFADAYPLLLISEASLADLNQRLPEAIPMNRFRPNLVVSGCDAYAEDSWRRIRINQIIFDVVKPCERCVITTTDQTTALRQGREPLATLATYRKVKGGVIFGQNLVHRGRGEIQVGSPVEVLS
jgi:uncharacterized protein